MSVQTQCPEFHLNLDDPEVSGRRPGNSGGGADDGSFDQILPVVVDRWTPGNPAVGPDLEEIGMARDKGVLPPRLPGFPPSRTQRNICGENKS